MKRGAAAAHIVMAIKTLKTDSIYCNYLRQSTPQYTVRVKNKFAFYDDNIKINNANESRESSLNKMGIPVTSCV